MPSPAVAFLAIFDGYDTPSWSLCLLSLIFMPAALWAKKVKFKRKRRADENPKACEKAVKLYGGLGKQYIMREVYVELVSSVECKSEAVGLTDSEIGIGGGDNEMACMKVDEINQKIDFEKSK